MSTRNDALEEAAKFAEFYAEERMRLVGDSIMHDPLLSGGRWTGANIAASKEAQIDGTINSAAYHAAMQIAEHLRGMKDAPCPTRP